MKKIITMLMLSFILLPSAFGQKKIIQRIQIRHADPMYILKMLRGDYVTQPEYSTIQNSWASGSTSGFSWGTGGGSSGSFRGQGFGGASMGGQYGSGRGN